MNFLLDFNIAFFIKEIDVLRDYPTPRGLGSAVIFFISSRHTVTEYVRQGSIGAEIQEYSLAMTKQSEVAKTFFIGHDPEKEQERHPTMGRLDEGI